MNNFFDKIYVLSLITNKERQEFIKYQFAQLGLEFEFIYGTDFYNFNDLTWPDPYRRGQKDGTNTAKDFGCAITHYNAVLQAYHQYYNNVLILEDDICLHKNFVNELNFDSIPSDADFVTYDFRKAYSHEEQEYIDAINANYDFPYLKIKDYEYFYGGMAYAFMNNQTMGYYLDSQHKYFVQSDLVYGIWKDTGSDINIYIPTKCIGISQGFYNDIFMNSNYSYKPSYDNMFFRCGNYNSEDFFEPQFLHIDSRRK